MVPEDLDRLLAAWERLTGHAPRHLFLDEIQLLPDWSRVLRSLHNRRQFTIVITGSNSSLLTREVATELRGRYEDVRMLPFSFRELLDFEKQLKAAGLAGSKRTLAQYLAFLREAFFIFTAEKYSPSLRSRMQTPSKVYLADTGFGLLTGGFPANRGRWRENAAAVEWVRRDQPFCYWHGRRECDFVLTANGRPTTAWQVCWEVTPENEPRELAGLAEAASATRAEAGGILTFNQDGERPLPGGGTAKLLPMWKWLLSG